MKLLILFVCLFCYAFAQNVATTGGDYGGALNNLPNWNSRAIICCFNWGRQDKDWFAENILENENVMQSSYYKDQLQPLYLNSKIVNAAQEHATDMIEGNFLSDRGSDGSYPADRLERNGYTGYTDLQTQNVGDAFLDGDSFLLCKFYFCQDGNGQVGANCKTDSNNPYIREKVMHEDINESGAGYNMTTEITVFHRYKIDWEAAYRSAFEQPEHPVATASHLFDYQANIKFLLNYYESSNGEQPEWVAVSWNDGTWNTYRMVESGFGTYTYTGTRFEDCYPYFYIIKDSNGKIWRYPEDQNLRTANWVGDEDTCGGLSTVPSECDPTLDCNELGACQSSGVCSCIDGWGGNTCTECPGDGPSKDKELKDQTVKAGEFLTYVFDSDTFSNDTDNIYSAEQSNGQPLPEWLAFNPDTKNFTGTGGDHCTKTYTIKVIATDCGGSASATFEIDLVNEAPDFNSLDDQPLNVEEEFEFQFAEDAFTDETELYYSSTLEDGSDLPEWIDFNSDNRTFNGSVPDEPTREFTIKVTASDGCPLSASGTFKILAADSQPKIYSDLKDFNKKILESWSYEISDEAFSGGSLEYAAERTNGDWPTWVHFTKASKTFTIDNSEIPAMCDETFTFEITATNGEGDESNTFNLAVENGKPEINKNLVDQSWKINTENSYTYGPDAFEDPQGEDLTITSTSLESWLTWSNTEEKFSTDGATECGEFDVTLYIKDSCQDNDMEDGFTITIEADQISQNTEISDANLVAGDLFNFGFDGSSFSQPQGLTLKFHSTNHPGWATFDESSLQYTGTAPDSASTTEVTLEVYTDECGLSKTVKFNIIVTEEDDDLVSPANLINFSFVLLLILLSYFLF
ncbi:hypothetical protein M0813_25169 [Anaeramoeba flamelloides]|uniref:EGF-like domain-containing protein n=1 Tax=Anaeramoeba flamelloides TaxID=1746091 RepID=A0ABQ8Y391_9EUKA|nr:hypothetical protein M0813_25169 [Anaeramoeba flamelloides]